MMSQRMSRALGIAMACVAAGPTACGTGGETTAGVRAEGAWVRAVTLPAEGSPVNTAAYLTIVNPAAVVDSLVGAETTVAGRTEVHRTRIDEEGLATMGPAGAVEVPAGGSVRLEPGGLHVMLLDVAHGLASGDTVDIVLRFASGTEVTVEAEVRPF